MEKRFKIKNLFLFLVSITSCFTSSFFGSRTYDFRMDKICYEINDYNKVNYSNGFVSPIFSIEKEDTITYNNLISYFYYNFLVNGCREMVNQDIALEFEDGYQVPIALAGQDTFTLKKTDISKPDDEFRKYRLERNMFNTYFYDEIFEDGRNNITRFGTASFIFVSDLIADQIISHFSFDSYDDKNLSYKEMIMNEHSSKVYLVVNGMNTNISLCINNVVYSDTLAGKRINELYGEFGVCYFNTRFSSVITSRFEIDLKADPFGNKNSFNAIKQLGYNTEDCTYKLFKFEKNNGYVFNEKITKSLTKMFYENEKNTFYDIAFYLSIALGAFLFIVLSCFFFGKTISCVNDIFAYIFIVLFFVFSIVCSFIYMNIYITLPLIVFFFLYAYRVKEVLNFVYKKLFFKTNPEIKEAFFKISI